jgi:hypothetical protein
MLVGAKAFAVDHRTDSAAIPDSAMDVRRHFDRKSDAPPNTTAIWGFLAIGRLRQRVQRGRSRHSVNLWVTESSIGRLPVLHGTFDLNQCSQSLFTSLYSLPGLPTPEREIES